MEQSIYRALIVDDEPLIREATARAMSAHSFCCDTACDGREAMKLYAQHRHDLVVTDLRMPNYHGHSLILKLMQDSEPPHVVVLTGVANSNLVRDLFSRGVHDIVEKPIDYQVFATKMMSLFEWGGWDSSQNQGLKIGLGSQHTPQIQKIESAIEIFSLCVPESLDNDFANAALELSEPPTAMLQFLERLSTKEQKVDERRQFDRSSFLSSGIAIPVNKDFVVQDDASKITFNDLSAGGACLFHTRSFPTDYVALRWQSVVHPRQHLKAVMQISRCHPLGPFYEVAGAFVMRD